jgi:hypothetical protein
MSDAELLAAERDKTRRLRNALAFTIGLLVLVCCAFAWWTAQQDAELRAERARAERLESEAQAEYQRARVASEHALRKEGETRTAARKQFEEGLRKAAQLGKPTNGFTEPREPAPPEVAPPPRPAKP